MIKNLNEIVKEWAYRVDNGQPNPKKSTHLYHLSEILIEYKWPFEVIEELLQNLNEDDIVKKKQPDGSYGSPYTVKNHNPDRGQELVKKDASPEDIKSVEKGEEPEKEKSKVKNKNVKDFEDRINKRMDSLSEEQKELTKNSLEKMNTLYDDNATPEQQKEAAQWLVDNAGFSTNENRKKAYLNKLGGMRKIISGDAGTTKSADLVNKVSSLVELKTFDAKSVKQGFTTKAKPDLGNENIVKPNEDENLQKFFDKNPLFSKVRKGLHGIYGVKDEDGKVKIPSSEHSKDYLEQSINNPALQNTIDYAKQQSEAGTTDKGVQTSLEEHQKRLQNLTKDYDVPSQQAADAIANSYNNLMVGLHKADSDVANSIMKQLAENNLYEQELAKGEEVYLPSAPNFPAGDKIKGGTLERVSLVSCKWGKTSGRIYGCPANSKTICELHQDKSKQNNQGQYLGEKGHTLVINDDLIKGANKEETIQKTSKFIEDTLNEVNLGDTFSEDERKQIATSVGDYMEDVDRIKKEIADSNPADKTAYWKSFDKKVSQIEDKYKKKMGSIITTEKAGKLIGENNAKNLVQKGGVKIEALMSAIEISNNIRTNESLNELEHNKQYYDENGEPKFDTDKGTQNPDDYSITFRTKRTAGRTGGGCQMSYTGDGKPAPTDLNKDGSVVDHKTGKEREV